MFSCGFAQIIPAKEYHFPNMLELIYRQRNPKVHYSGPKQARKCYKMSHVKESENLRRPFFLSSFLSGFLQSSKPQEDKKGPKMVSTMKPLFLLRQTSFSIKGNAQTTPNVRGFYSFSEQSISFDRLVSSWS